MHVRWIAASVFVAFSGIVSAQSPAVLGKDDAAFASALKRAGYIDLAEKLIKTIETAGKVGPEEAVNLKAVHLDLRQDLARRETDPLKRKDLLRTILQEKEDLVTQYKGRPVAEEARNSLPDIYRELGDAITAAIAREKDPGLITQLQKEGSDNYTKAEDSFKARIEELRKLDTSSPDVANQLWPAMYNLPRMMYFHALLYPKEEFRRKDLLTQAIKGFQEFGLDYGTLLMNFEALILEGLCHKELGEMDDAKASFKDAFRFPASAYDKDTKGQYPLTEEEAGTVSEACLQWMNLLIEEKDYAGAIALAKEYIDTTPGPYEARRGLPILAAKAEAHLALSDAKSAADAADKLVAEDPRGPWGSKGREIQGRLMGAGPVDAKRTLAIARSDYERGDALKALQRMRQVVEALKGNPDEAKLGPEAYLFIGSIYAQRGNDHEAALAFDTGAERYANSERAPELLYQAIGRYTEINKTDKRPYFKKRIDERMKTLAAKYPNSDYAQNAVSIEADQAAGDKRYLDAAEQYAKVLPSSKSYLNAQCSTAEMYFRYAIEVLGKDPNKAAEMKTYLAQAEPLFKKVMTDVDVAVKKTVAFDQIAKIEAVGMKARSWLAQLYLKTDRPAEVITLLNGIDDRYSANQDAIALFWGFRIQALQKQGKLDEAVAMLDALAKKDPKSKTIAGAARLVGQALDGQASAVDAEAKQLETDGKKSEAEAKKHDANSKYKKAAQYYAMAARAILTGDVPRVEDVDLLANRLFALGLILNDVPETQNTFVGWDPKRTRDTDLFQLAAEMFESSLNIKPNDKSRASLGSLYGFLGKWDKAATKLGELFDSKPIIVNKKINVALANENQYLTTAVLEQGVAENHLALADNDNDRFRRAQVIFDALSSAYSATSRMGWNARYYAIRNRYDMGDYQTAKTEFNELERKSDNMGAEFGTAELFAKLKEDLKNK